MGIAPETVRLQTLALHEAGIVTQVNSAYANHLEVRDHTLLDGLESDEKQVAMEEALAEFDQHKQEEAEHMSRLFSEGEHERRRRDKLKEMDKGLMDFERKKPRNPFDDD